MGNPSVDKNDLSRWQVLDLQLGRDAADFLDVKYLITEDKRQYMATLSAQLKELGYREKMEDDGYSLWEKILEKREFLDIQMGNPDDIIFLEMGWYLPEGNFRWSEKKSSVMVKVIKKRPFYVRFTIEPFVSNEKTTVYVNKKKIGTVLAKKGVHDYSLPVAKELLVEGINMVHFISAHSYRPSDIVSGNEDARELSNKFYSIALQDIP